MRAATQADLPEITAFLNAHIATAMFPLSNLRQHGWGSAAQRAYAAIGFVQTGTFSFRIFKTPQVANG